MLRLCDGFSVGDLLQQIGDVRIEGLVSDGYSRSENPRLTTKALPVGLYVAVGVVGDRLILWQTREGGFPVAGQWWAVTAEDAKRMRML